MTNSLGLTDEEFNDLPDWAQDAALDGEPIDFQGL